jgi:hypothetical protein
MKYSRVSTSLEPAAPAQPRALFFGPTSSAKFAAVAAAVSLALFGSAAIAQAAGDPCALPGVTVVTDPDGDQNAVGTSDQDIQSVSVAELAADTSTLTFTLKVADLTTPSVNGNWYVLFKAPNGTTYFVDMETDITGAPTYKYGTRDATTGFTTTGDADGGSFTADGFIHIKISNSKVGSLSAGSNLTAVSGQTSRLIGAVVGGVVVTIDSTEDGAYKLAGNSSCGSGTPTPSPTATPTPTATPSATPPSGGGAGAPRYFNFPAPQGLGDDSGEPSIGIDYKTEKKFSNSQLLTPNGGTTMYFGGFSPAMLRVTFSDCASPADALWEAKSLLTASTPRGFGDPILFTDSITGRTFVSQLEGLTPAGSTTDITDDDGETFQPSEGSSLPSDIDHQTFGGGPFAPPLDGVPNPVYPHAVYYAAQSVADARAALSVDGGYTFGPASPMYTIAQCAGLHGHIKVAPDGTVYVPQKSCGGSLPYHEGGDVSVIVSEDNGTTWNIRSVPNAPTRVDDDPSVGIGSDGTVYLGWQSADGHPRAAVSHDKGVTWSKPVDVGAAVTNGAPVLNTAFPAVTAGDPDRAAFAFYGSETGGNNYNCGAGAGCSDPDFPGVWYLYVASTFDGGKTWTTQNITPGDPIQRSGICDTGTCRNLLDFFDIQTDKEGRVLVGWDDGCIGACVDGPPNSYSTKATISRQTGGKRLFAAFDPKEPAVPGAPNATGTVDAGKTKVDIAWQIPDNGGAAIGGYHVYRRAGTTGNFTQIATVTETSYRDTMFDKTKENFYYVTAFNAQGEGPFCKTFEAEAGVVQTPCQLPGVLAVTDTNPDGSDNDGGQNTPPDPSLNIRQIFVAEPDLGDGVNKLVFTMQVGPNGTILPSSEWYIIWNRINPDADFDRYYVAMRSDATGALTYEYGKFGVPLDTSGNVPNPNSNTPVKLGNADKGSYDLATGVIRIELSRSKAENIPVGKPLNGLNGRNFTGHPDQNPRGPRNQAIAADITNDGSYTIVGNAACVLNHAPTAALTANPKAGQAPLKVTFDASGSTDPDAGDGIATYTFTFGDGTEPVTQNVPTITHTYTSGGAFFATLQVRDSHGLISTNTATVTIQTSVTLLNISTRERVLTGDNVAIGGFIVTGDKNKKVILRGIGPSLQKDGQPFPGRLKDPTLELHGPSGIIATNDNWKDTQKSQIEASGVAPDNDRESAIIKSLAPGKYTVILRGKDNTSGIGLVEIYDLDRTVPSQLANLSTRGVVGTGDGVLIGGFVAGPAPAGPGKIIVRAIGPSLDSVPNRLPDPTLELHNANGDTIASNDNWKDSQKAAIQASGVAPTNDKESAIVVNGLEPGLYTAIVRGKNGNTGVGLVEVYNLK